MATLDDAEEQSDVDDDSETGFLGSTLSGNALAQTLLDTQTSNELGLLRSEVRRLRSKVASLEREKDDMVDNFRTTTKILLERIKELEGELSHSQTRPQTAAVIDRIEAKGKDPKAHRYHSGVGHLPEVLRIEEETCIDNDHTKRHREEGRPSQPEEGSDMSVCGNCGHEIPSGNLVSHSVFCYRNNYRCSSCEEVIALKDKESHVEEWTNGLRLLQATSKRDLETVQAMAAHGADFTIVSHPETKDSVLHVAARIGDVELISFFMGFGVEVDPLNLQGDTPLHIAAETAEIPALKLLVELGANLNVSNGRGETPLMLVCRRGSAQAAKFLLEMKADAEACTKLGDTALQIAQRLGFQETVLALATAGVSLRPGTPNRARSGSPLVKSTALNSMPAGTSGGAYPPLPPRPGRPPQPTSAGRALR